MGVAQKMSLSHLFQFLSLNELGRPRPINVVLQLGLKYPQSGYFLDNTNPSFFMCDENEKKIIEACLLENIFLNI